MPLLGGPKIPAGRLTVILGDALAQRVHGCELELRLDVAPAPRPQDTTMPPSRSVRSDTLALLIHGSKVVLTLRGPLKSAARRYQIIASPTCWATPWPVAYIMPRSDLCFRMVLFGRAPVPDRSLGRIPVDAGTPFMHRSETELRRSESRLGSAFIPPRGLGEVLLCALSPLHQSERESTGPRRVPARPPGKAS